jgi:hypothetical protein
MHVNVAVGGNDIYLQILMPAPENCITIMPVDESGIPQVLCIAPIEYLFLVTEVESGFFPRFAIENVMKDEKRLMLASFVLAPLKIGFQTLSDRLRQDNPAAQQVLSASGQDPLGLSVCFDFLFFPAFQDRTDFFRICKQRKELEFCLCKSARLWTQESGPLYIYREKVGYRNLMSADRTGVKVSDDLSVVL